MKNTLLKIFCLFFMLLFNAIPSFAGDLHFQIYSPDTNTVIKTDLDENDVQNFSRVRDTYGERINIKFNKAGAVKLKKLTAEHVGKELAIQHFNTEFLFSAKIMEPVNGGEISITSSDLNFDSLEQSLIQAGLKKKRTLFETVNTYSGFIIPILIFVLLGYAVILILCSKKHSVAVCFTILMALITTYLTVIYGSLMNKVGLWSNNPILLASTILTIISIAVLMFKLYEQKYHILGRIVLSLVQAITLAEVLCMATQEIYTVYMSIMTSTDFHHRGIVSWIILILMYGIPNTVVFLVVKYCSKSAFSSISSTITKSLPKVLPVSLSLLVIFLAISSFSWIKNSVSMPACDSKFAEEQVLEIFKLHNYEYKDNIERGLLGDIRFSDPVPQSYNKEIKKYKCTGRVTMYPRNGLLKSEYGIMYSNKVGICDIEYSIYKEHGKNTVRATSCSTKYDDIRWREF